MKLLEILEYVDSKLNEKKGLNTGVEEDNR